MSSTAARAQRLWKFIRTEHVLIGTLLAVWSSVLLVHMLSSKSAGTTFAGSDGPFASDQLQYLAWARDAGRHLLAGNLFDIPAGHRVFAHPMWLLSGLMWRAGVPIADVLLPWKLAGIVALTWSIQAYVSRFVTERWARFGAAVTALFYVTPILSAISMVGATRAAEGTVRMAGEAMTAITLWGYAPATLAVALIPAYLLCAERAVDAGPGSHRRSSFTAVIGFAIAWLHPWQGVTVLGITVVLIAFDRHSTVRVLLPATVATCVPLAGYTLLARVDQGWRAAEAATGSAGRITIYAIPALLPIVALAAFAVRKPHGDLGERALLAWPCVAFVAALTTPSFPQHALEGISIPLAILATRSVLAVRTALPRMAALAVTTLLLTLPGAVVIGAWGIRSVRSDSGHLLADDDARALRYLGSLQRNGGVLAAPALGAAVPAWTGHPTWVGHPTWTPDYARRRSDAEHLFSGGLSGPDARRLVVTTLARYVLVGCSDSLDAPRVLDKIVTEMRRYGCAAVYEIREPARATVRTTR